MWISKKQKGLLFGQPFLKYLRLRYNDLAFGQIVVSKPDIQKFIILSSYL